MTRYAQAAVAGQPGGQIVNEFKMLVRECHKRGIEVIMDVVFNHTSEGNEKGPVLSMRWVLFLAVCSYFLHKAFCKVIILSILSTPQSGLWTACAPFHRGLPCG